ncbi:chitooligosaccharidolytic beta-N-acetylglucosaminidase isoform X1 [Folsomia candida]|uniref:chitooligosaccharidolytic beta-N-acetylglucosaminidase isoform X1 n=2 Tax=Folsomia candida TaxID=158441 RepID=UPI000B9081EE|nr:chitooligosaccharidolytic beta-N-acetylglucosaminidase isoform X1 [Folsomia candida]
MNTNNNILIFFSLGNNSPTKRRTCRKISSFQLYLLFLLLLLFNNSIIGSLALIEGGDKEGGFSSTKGEGSVETPSVENLLQTYRNSSLHARQLASPNGDDIQYTSPWTWVCLESICKRQLARNTVAKVPQNVCWLNCGRFGALWPFPTIKALLGHETIPLYPQNVEVTAIHSPHKAVTAMLGYAGNVLLDSLFRMHPKSEGQSAFPLTSNGRGIERNRMSITLTTESDETKMSLNSDESYSLSVTSAIIGSSVKVQVQIYGATFFGVRHGLESLGQLLAFDEENECLQIVAEAEIEDRPAFKYRGVMVDTSRNFIPILNLKKVVDAMSYNKLNVLHLHLTDSNSFPFYSKRIPYMTTYGAYSASQIYTPKDLKDLILYARLRGVKIIPELDLPAHVGNGWNWGPLMGLGELAVCVNAEPWRQYCGQPPCGTLNVINNYTYLVMGELYKDMLEVFDNDLFHMGGDEVFFPCWSSRQDMRDWLKNRGTNDYMDLWGYFQGRAFDKLIEANGGKYITPIVWTSDMTNRARHFLHPSDYIIQIWTGATQYEVRELLENKYKVIFSNLDSLYLDHGFGTWLGLDHFWTIKTWQNLYDNDLIKIAEHHLGANSTYYAITTGQILGAEVTLWSEKVDQHNMEMKLWPRSAAFAERMWSSPQNRTITVDARLAHHTNRMKNRGIHTDRLQPESCYQISGYCHDSNSRL